MSTPRPEHVLYVAWGFPPCRGGGVYRALATANAFAQRGARVSVLTADRETFERFTGTDPSLEERIHPGVSVHRVPFDWPAVETDVRRWSTYRALAAGSVAAHPQQDRHRRVPRGRLRPVGAAARPRPRASCTAAIRSTS